MRIVSLVPSITELLHYFDLDDETVGITKFCVHPEHWYRTKCRVGGTKNVHVNTVRSLHPSLIIANKEENIEKQVREMSLFSDILLTDVAHFEDALKMIQTVGTLTGKTSQANDLIAKIQHRFNHKAGYMLTTAAYLIWKGPLMSVGGDTFIHSMMEKAGFQNVLADKMRYPEVTMQQLQEIQPQYILLSSEPYPFKEQDLTAMQKLLPFSKVLLVDGEMFSWYGSRMLQAADYFNRLRNTL